MLAAKFLAEHFPIGLLRELFGNKRSSVHPQHTIVRLDKVLPIARKHMAALMPRSHLTVARCVMRPEAPVQGEHILGLLKGFVFEHDVCRPILAVVQDIDRAVVAHGIPKLYPIQRVICSPLLISPKIVDRDSGMLASVFGHHAE